MTLATEASTPDRLEQAAVPQDAIVAILHYKKFVYLGAVSPDLSYLKLTGNGHRWADKMHYESTGEIMKSLARKVRSEPEHEIRNKKLAWLLGYTLHVVGDTTIHPVVRLKVGEYDQNKTAHRTCEMHQDAHIFPRLNVGSVGLGNFIGSTICTCTDDGGNLDGAIRTLWETALEECYPDEFSTNRPITNEWFKSFNEEVKFIGEMSLVPLARHVCAGQGLAYPALTEIEDQYIRGLKTPRNLLMSYDEIFDFAIHNVVSFWAVVSDYVINGNESALGKILNLNLDTGMDSEGVIRMWS